MQHTINGRQWFRKGDGREWTSNYVCADGDGCDLFVSDGHFELYCFSGIGTSSVIMDELDFAYMQHKVEIDFTQPFEVQAITIADYFCRLFCEWKGE